MEEETVKKLNDEKILVTKPSEEMTKEFVDSQVAICQSTVDNATVELNYWLNLQNSF